jgi:putative peptide zinc metalloprotease protein
MLPQLVNGICISPFLNGAEHPQRFLVEAGARSYVVNLRTRVLIEALQSAREPNKVVTYIHTRTNEVITEEGLLAAISRLPRALFDLSLAYDHRSSIIGRVSLIPVRVVEWIAGRTALLFSPPALIVCLVAVMGMAPFACRAANESIGRMDLAWGGMGVLTLGAIAGALVHELGHASAVARNGFAPGQIGFGFYWIYPVFYTDVNAAWKLPPNKRLMVDLGGIYFQVLFVAALTPLAFMGPVTNAVRLLILLSLYSVLQNLNPVFKMDGYWILADLVRIPNLHARTFQFWRTLFIRGIAGTQARRVFILYGFGVGAYCSYMLAVLPGIIQCQLLPRMSSAGAHLLLCIDSWRQADWEAALRQLALTLQVAAVPVVVVLTLILWLAGFCRRRCEGFGPVKA